MAIFTTELGFIGAGNMAEAIARGVLRAKLYTAGQLSASDPVEARRALFAQQLGIQAVEDSAVVARQSRVLLLAVKPQMMAAALAQIAPVLSPDTLLVSIAAGISCAFIEKALPGKPRVVRVMPNTPMLVNAGMSGIAKGTHATDADLATVEALFAAGGKVVRVEEKFIDAITAMSGSGPAYFFYLVEAMIAAGVKLGLSEADATVLAKQTALGAALLLEQSTDTPAELRRKVTSPGGTTQAAIETMQRQDFPGTVAAAIAAAERRGKELGK